jgi:hypothetical protein
MWYNKTTRVWSDLFSYPWTQPIFSLRSPHWQHCQPNSLRNLLWRREVAGHKRVHWTDIFIWMKNVTLSYPSRNVAASSLLLIRTYKHEVESTNTPLHHNLTYVYAATHIEVLLHWKGRRRKEAATLRPTALQFPYSLLPVTYKPAQRACQHWGLITLSSIPALVQKQWLHDRRGIEGVGWKEKALTPLQLKQGDPSLHKNPFRVASIVSVKTKTPHNTEPGNYEVVQIWPGQTVTCLHTNSPGHIWTILYFVQMVTDFRNSHVPECPALSNSTWVGAACTYRCLNATVA